MKKFSVFAVLLLILAMTTVFVACNQNDAKPIKLKEGMTLDSVKTEFKNLESMTYEAYDKDGNVGFAMTSTKNGYYRASFANGYSYAAFIEDDRFYEFRTEGNKLDYDIISTAGFDVDTSSFSMVEPMLEDLFEEMEEKGFRIENNNIIIEYGAQDDSYWSKIVAKDFNTALITVPESFKKSYKSLSTTKSMLVFEDIDGTTCKLADTVLTLNSLTVPERNGEKTVVEANLDGISTVVIPKTVKKVEGLFDDTDITFLGTKAEWFAVNLGVTQEKSLYNVHCSDGDIKVGDDVVKSNPDTPDTPDTPDQPDKPDTPDKPTDDPNYPGTKLTPGMTLAEVKDFLKKAQSMTVKSYSLDGIGWVEICKVTQNGWSGYYDGYSEYNFAEFIENGRYYELKESSRTIVNIGNYDVQRPTSYIANIRNLLIEELDENGVFAIEDGKLIIDFKTGQRSVASDFGSTELYIPEKYTNYKTLSANKTVLSYTDENASAYGISAVNIKLNSLTVPSMNNGRTVASVNFSNNVTNVTIPNTVTSFSGLAEGANVTYQGTKEEWAEIKFAYTNDQEPFNVHCTDGDIQSGSAKLQPKPKVDKIQAFFNTLWDNSTSLGSQTISQNDDFKTAIDLVLALDTVDAQGNIYSTVNVGLDLTIVLGRGIRGESSANSAFKMRLYDPDNGENWITLYYFLDDVYNLYVDFANQNMKIPFEYFNECYVSTLSDFLTVDSIGTEGNMTSINAVINWFARNMRTDAISAIINGFFKLGGTDLRDAVASNWNLFSSILGKDVKVEDICDDEIVNFRKVLTNENIANMFFINDETIIDQKGFYSTALDMDGDILSMLVNMLPSEIGKVINEDTDVRLQYRLNGGALDSFEIVAGFASLKKANENLNDVYPRISISIEGLEFATARGDEIERSMTALKADYSEEAVFETVSTLDIKGISLDATAFDARNNGRFSDVVGLDNLVLDGQFVLSSVTKLDLKDKNNAAVNATLSYRYFEGDDPVTIAQMSVVNNKLAVQINQDATMVGGSGNNTYGIYIWPTAVYLFGDYIYNAASAVLDEESLSEFGAKFFADDSHLVINSDFRGIVFENIDLPTLFKYNLFGNTLNYGNSADSTNESVLDPFCKLFRGLWPLVSQDDNGLTVKTKNIRGYRTLEEVVCTLIKIGSGGNSFNLAQQIINTDERNAKILTELMHAIKIDGASYDTEREFIETLFGAQVTIKIDSTSSGFSGEVAIKINNSTSIGFSTTTTAKSGYVFGDLSSDIDTSNGCSFVISEIPTSGYIDENGVLRVEGIAGSEVYLRYYTTVESEETDSNGNTVVVTKDCYVTKRIDGVWTDNTFVSSISGDELTKEFGYQRPTLLVRTPEGNVLSAGVQIVNFYQN